MVAHMTRLTGMADTTFARGACRVSVPLAHLRLRFSGDADGNLTWGLLPGDPAHDKADAPLVSGFLGAGAEALTPQALRDAADNLEVFLRAEGRRDDGS